MNLLVSALLFLENRYIQGASLPAIPRLGDVGPEYRIDIITARRQDGRIRPFARVEKQPDRRREIPSVARPPAHGSIHIPVKRGTGMAGLANSYGRIVAPEQPHHVGITQKRLPV